MKHLITLPEAAKRLNVNISTLRAWVREGRIPAYRMGQRFARLDWDRVLELLATQGTRSIDTAVQRVEADETPEDSR